MLMALKRFTVSLAVPAAAVCAVVGLDRRTSEVVDARLLLRGRLAGGRLLYHCGREMQVQIRQCWSVILSRFGRIR